MNHAPPRALIVSWLALLALLALTVALAYVPLGSFNIVVSLIIATAKGAIVAAVFMELRERPGLTVAFSIAGVSWLLILLWLAGVDYVTRPQFPPLDVR